MNKLITIIIIGIIMLSSNINAQEQGLDFQASLDKEIYEVGEPIIVSITKEMGGSVYIDIIDNGTLTHYIYVVDFNGTEAPEGIVTYNLDFRVEEVEKVGIYELNITNYDLNESVILDFEVVEEGSIIATEPMTEESSSLLKDIYRLLLFPVLICVLTLITFGAYNYLLNRRINKYDQNIEKIQNQ